jgi:hypothetical protein
VEAQRQLVSYDEVLRLTDLHERTFFRRLKQVDIPIFIDPRDHRRRLIERRDIPKLVRVQEVERSTTAA